MRSLPLLAQEHLASGYASDDDGRPRRPAGRFGALEGDNPAPKLTREEVLEYGVRQASAGPSTNKVRYIDIVKGSSSRLSRAQTKPRSSFEQHCALLRCLPGRTKSAGAPAFKSDMDSLRERHRFLRSEQDDDGSWEARLAKRYYDRLFKEYVLCDLAGFKRGQVGFRWRTESEVVQGKGQFSCGHKVCPSKLRLRSYEVDFHYCEAGDHKRALVKVRLCEPCSYKLHYRRLKAQLKRRRRQGAERRSRARRSSPERGAHVSSEDDAAGPSEEEGSPAGGAHASGAECQPTEAEQRLLDSLAWKGPDPEIRTRAEEFDEYFDALLV